MTRSAKTCTLVLLVLAGTRCRAKEPASESASTAPASITQGEIDGVRYLEQMTGGARPDERVPMIVVLHAMGGEPAGLLPYFQGYGGRARLILPYGHPYGGMYTWYDSVSEDVPASMVAPEADRIADTLAALIIARPTLGKPIVTGFSQGGIMTFALAVTHPQAIAAAIPISGLLPPSLYPPAATSEARGSPFPPVTAFHGADDLAVPTRAARSSVDALRQAGYVAELQTYAGLEHDISADEAREILARIGRVAERLK